MELIVKPSRNSLLLRAVVNIIFGLLVLLFPGLTLLILAFAFAVNIMIVGLYMIFEPAFDSKNKHAILTVMLGLATVAVGVFLMSKPLVNIAILSLLIAAWALLYGLVDLFIGFKLADLQESGAWLFVAAGVLSLIFAIYLAFNPLDGSLAVVWVLGLYALITGIQFAYQAYRLKPKTKAKK